MVVEKGLHKILIIADEPNWAFDKWTDEVVSYLYSKGFDIVKCFRNDMPQSFVRYRYIYVCWWPDIFLIKDKISKKQKILCRITDMVTWNKKSSLEWLRKFQSLIPLVYWFFASSVEIKHELNHYNIFNTSTIGDCINPLDFKYNAKLNIINDKPILGWSGNPNALVWMGFEDIKGFELIKSISLSKEYVFNIATNIPPKEMKYWYNNIDIFICSSKSEGTPLTVIEAMASGCIILSTKVGIIPEIKSQGIFVFDGTIKNFNEMLNKIVTLRKNWMHFKIQNRIEFENNWSTPIIGEKYIDWFIKEQNR